jgi:hypothetical protein
MEILCSDVNLFLIYSKALSPISRDGFVLQVNVTWLNNEDSGKW